MAMQSMPNKPARGADWEGWGDIVDANLRSIASDIPAVQASVNALTDRVTTAENSIAGKATLSGLASVATSGLYSDLIGKPTQSVIATTSAAARPTSDPAVIVAWHTAAPPTTLMLTGDYCWVPRSSYVTGGSPRRSSPPTSSSSNSCSAPPPSDRYGIIEAALFLLPAWAIWSWIVGAQLSKAR